MRRSQCLGDGETYSEKKPFQVNFGGFLLKNASVRAKSATFFSISSEADFALTPGAMAMRQSNRHQEGTELAQSPPCTIATFKSFRTECVSLYLGRLLVLRV